MALVLDGTNGVSGVDGTASNPSLEGTDSNTGVFFPAADTVAIGTGGTERLRVDTSGNVGIGTSSPLRKLDISGGGLAFTDPGGANRSIHWGDTTNIFPVTITGFSSSGNGYLAFNTNTFGNSAVERMRIDSSGNVGIGTSSPDALLTVNTVASFGAGSAAAPSIAARGDLDTGMWFAAANAVSFSTGGTERVRIDGAGDLYVGLDASSSPGRIISRRNLTGSYDTAAIIAEAASSSGNAGIALHCPGSNAPILRAERGAGNNLDSVNSTQSAFGNFRAAAFTVVSDYRIKENVVPLTNALNRISHLKPSQFNFVEGSMMYSGGVTIDGFIAHEVSAVVPEAVTGNKDDVKEDGTPKYQSLDQAKLIPLLTAAIQELKAELDAAKAEIAGLKGAAQ